MISWSVLKFMLERIGLDRSGLLTYGIEEFSQKKTTLGAVDRSGQIDRSALLTYELITS
jgi:hypothetical protein